MKKELAYFMIDESYGGNQDWFKDFFMRMGGCGAATACDISISLALNNGKLHLYPYDVKNLNKDNYVSFAMKMKPYLKPRMEGIKTLKIFMEGYQSYCKDVGETSLKIAGISGELLVETAATAITNQINHEIPVPFLMLRHKMPKMKKLIWHWFLIVGYEDIDNDLLVKIATYGAYEWLSLRELWNTGFKERGGIITIES